MYIKKIIEEIQNKKEFIGHNLVNSQYDYDHMVYVRVFEGCNLNCEHCFIPSNPKKIELDFYKDKQLTKQLIEHANINNNSKIYIQWHGGEPTLLGPEYLKNAIELIQEDNRFQYMHGIQTNLMNFHENTQQWIDLYKNYFGGHLGVSWDYAIRHVKLNSLTPEETNARFEDIFWKNLKLALNSGLEIYMVVTATKLFFEHFSNPFDFFEMMQMNNVTHLNFERVTKTGYARDSWEKIGLSNAEYSKYMSKFFKAYALFKENNPDVQLNISPFDGLLRSVVNLELSKKENMYNNITNKADIWDILSFKNQGYGCWSGQCDTRFHTIDSNGYKHGCTALTSEQDNKNKKLQQSISVQKIVWVGRNKKDSSSETNQDNMKEQREVILEQRKLRQDTCTGCEFLNICSSGCLSVEKIDSSGECSGAKELFKTIAKVIKPNFVS